jgi:hypothetical protein
MTPASIQAARPAHWLTSAELAEALAYATGSIRLTAAIITAREALDRIEHLERLLVEACDYIEAGTDPDEEHPESKRLRKAAGCE